MARIIAAINMTIDGFCDHTAIDPDAEIHDHYTNLLANSGTILYGRTTYHLMEYWRDILAKPTGIKSMDDFAAMMDSIPKIVFSHTLKSTGWSSATLATQPLEQEVVSLKQHPGKDILVGSRSLIIQLLQLNLIDELQLCIHPVVAGSGLPLFKNFNHRALFRLSETKTFTSGAVILYFKPLKTENRRS